MSVLISHDRQKLITNVFFRLSHHVESAAAGGAAPTGRRFYLLSIALRLYLFTAADIDMNTLRAPGGRQDDLCNLFSQCV